MGFLFLNHPVLPVLKSWQIDIGRVWVLASWSIAAELNVNIDEDTLRVNWKLDLLIMKTIKESNVEIAVDDHHESPERSKVFYNPRMKLNR